MPSLDVEGSVDKNFFPDVFTDPRAEDMTEDSQQWIRLFELVRGEGETKSNAYFYGHLGFMRLMGTRLKPSEQWGFVLEPVVGESSGGDSSVSNSCWASREQYEKSKRVLDPYRNDLVKLLGCLAGKG